MGLEKLIIKDGQYFNSRGLSVNVAPVSLEFLEKYGHWPSTFSQVAASKNKNGADAFIIGNDCESTPNCGPIVSPIHYCKITTPKEELDEQYLKARGFEITAGEPPEETSTPYFVLKEEDWSGLVYTYPDYCDSYFSGSYDRRNETCELDKDKKWYHPLNHDTNTLIEYLEGIVNNCVLWLPKNEFPAKEPIKLFVVDPAWNKVAESLVEKYPPQASN